MNGFPVHNANVQVIETCTILVTKSLNMRNKVAGWVCLSLAELMSPRDHREVTFELTRAVTFFSRDTCYYKPVPEFILKCLAAIARNLMRCQVCQRENMRLFFLFFVLPFVILQTLPVYVDLMQR